MIARRISTPQDISSIEGQEYLETPLGAEQLRIFVSRPAHVLGTMSMRVF